MVMIHRSQAVLHQFLVMMLLKQHESCRRHLCRKDRTDYFNISFCLCWSFNSMHPVWGLRGFNACFIMILWIEMTSFLGILSCFLLFSNYIISKRLALLVCAKLTSATAFWVMIYILNSPFHIKCSMHLKNVYLSPYFCFVFQYNHLNILKSTYIHLRCKKYCFLRNWSKLREFTLKTRTNMRYEKLFSLWIK